jgi:hypothetical protein
MPRKLVRLSIDETSGVDHPAHLVEGWVVMKSASESDVTAVLDELRPDEAAFETPVDETPVDEVAEIEAVEPEAEAVDAEVAEETLTTPVSKEETMTDTTPVDVAAPEVVIVPAAAELADVIKAMPESIRKILDDSQAEAAEALAIAKAAQTELANERNARADEAAVIKAAKWSSLTLDPTVVGPALRRLAESDGTLAGEIVKALDAANAVAETHAVFEEIGSDSTPTDANDAYSQIERLAKAAVEGGTSPSIDSAILAVAQANPDLYAQYLSERSR